MQALTTAKWAMFRARHLCASGHPWGDKRLLSHMLETLAP